MTFKKTKKNGLRDPGIKFVGAKKQMVLSS